MSCIVIEIQQVLLAQFKDEVEKEFIEVEKVERRKKALLQAQQRRDSLSSFGQESPLKSRKTTKTDSQDVSFNVDIECSDPMVDKHLPPRQFSVFDHSSQQNLKNINRWVKMEKAEQAPASLQDAKEFEESIETMLRAKTPPTEGSIKRKVEQKRWYILRTGQVPSYASCVHQGNAIVPAGSGVDQKEEKKIDNLSQYAAAVPKRWIKKFHDLMSVEEDMKSFFPHKYKEPMSALSIGVEESQNDLGNDQVPGKELRIGSVSLGGQDDIEQAIGQLKGVVRQRN